MFRNQWRKLLTREQVMIMEDRQRDRQTRVQEAMEPTFKNYNSAQAQAYAASRNSYHENLFRVILEHHQSTGGGFGTLLDVGCGPGNSTRPLAKHFQDAYGVDPSQEMINTAKSISATSDAGETATGGKINFVVCRAEEVASSMAKAAKVDLLISAMAVGLSLASIVVLTLIDGRHIGLTCHDSGNQRPRF